MAGLKEWNWEGMADVQGIFIEMGVLIDTFGFWSTIAMDDRLGRDMLGMDMCGMTGSEQETP